MLNNGNSGAEIESRECKVDLEEQLQRARKRREKVEQDITAFWSLGDYYKAERAAVSLLGAMHVELKATIANEQRWLDEIDKPDES